MKYSIERNYHSDFKCAAINKLNHRSYFVPFDSKDEADKYDVTFERYSSRKLTVLNSGWGFKYYKSMSELPSIFDTESEIFDDIAIPSTWQRTGYENPWYLNTRYQFKMRPPHIDNDVPVGVYRNKFNRKLDDGRVIITFLGVCSCVYLYVNGKFAGYAEGSHDMNEFDITDFAAKGDNEILAVVTKFCNGSYLECQDMFRENGIFRDVYVTELCDTDIIDISVVCSKNFDGDYKLTAAAEIEGNSDGGYSVSFELSDADGSVIAGSECAVGEGKTIETVFDGICAKEWSAEIPNLYKFFVTLKKGGETVTSIRQFIGFKTVEVRGEKFLVNGQPVKLLGVNHHDTDAKNGWVMTPDELRRDVEIIKSYNCNAVRMSHYPPDPVLISLSDIYGLYVVDEADIECHNVYSNPLNQRYGRISNNMIWEERFIERVDSMFKRDRNHASIVMWSLGNEAGGYKCHDAAYKHLKSLTDIPVHYEGVIHTKRQSYDVISEMYTHTPKLQAIGEKKFAPEYEGKPYFLCEYAHAMGVGPGALKEYVDMFFKYDNLMGGCIWEFADHAVYDESAEYKYTYGGDHNEPKHDGNFCVDGLFRPDRSPSSGALNMKAVYRPVTAEFKAGSVVSFKNRMTFKAADYIDCEWELCRGGVKLQSGKLPLDIGAQCFKDYDLGFSAPMDGDVYLTIRYIDRNLGTEIAAEQIILSESAYNVEIPGGGALTMTSNRRVYTVSYDGGSIIYDANTGELVSYSVSNTELMNQDPESGVKGLEPGIYRAEIDNDRFIKMAWQALGYDKSHAQFKRAKVKENNGVIEINSSYVIKGLGSIAKCKINYAIFSDGSIRVGVKFNKAFKLMFYSDVPRAGVAIELPREFENVEYYAYGDRENLSDMKEHALLGVYKTKASEMEEFYIKPQDNGNRTGARFVWLTNDAGRGLEIIHDGKYFDFRVKRYALKNILGAGHIEDVSEKDTTVLYVDGFYRGAGSQSCGQAPLEGHKPNLKKPLSFSFFMRPIK